MATVLPENSVHMENVGLHTLLTNNRDNAYRSAPVAQIQRNAERGALLDGETAWHEMQLG